MEFFAIFLSLLLSVISPAGLIIDNTAEKAIRSQFEKVEQLQVRVDNAPSYQIVEGKIGRVRVAGRGLWLTEDFRIADLEVETDPINVDIGRLRKGGARDFSALREPAQAGVRLVLTEEDINKALQGPDVTSRLRNLGIRVLGSQEAEQLQRYDIVNPRVEFLDNNRLRFQVEIQERGYSEQLAITVESGLSIISGRQLQLIDLAVLVNGEPAPARLVKGLSQGISRQLNLQTLERSGILARLLQLKITSEQLEMAAFVQVKPR